MSDSLSAQARALIERAEREEEAPSRAALERVRQRVLAVGAGLAGSVVGVESAAASALLGGAKVSVAAKATALQGVALNTGLTLTVIKSACIGGAIGVVALGAPVVIMNQMRADSRPAQIRPSAIPGQRSVPRTQTSQPAHPERWGIQDPLENSTSGSAARQAGGRLENRALDSAASELLRARRAPRVMQERGNTALQEKGTPALVKQPPARAPEVASDASLGSTLSEELSILENVQLALRDGAGERALLMLDETAKTHGQLRSERLAAEVFAACQTGQVERARTAAQQLLRDSPATPTTARVRSSCVGDLLGHPAHPKSH